MERAAEKRFVKILIADDNATMRALPAMLLRKWGYQVLEAADGVAAWEMLQRESVSFVISDWMMPEVDGRELIRRIRASGRPHYVYTILLTARSEQEDLVAGMEAGADDFVTKPYQREELHVRLRAGERIIKLERALEEQNRALREAQDALLKAAAPGA